MVPSLPGFGYSDNPATTGWGTEKIAAAWVELMGRLGYSKFAAHGGDWGGTACTARRRHHSSGPRCRARRDRPSFDSRETTRAVDAIACRPLVASGAGSAWPFARRSTRGHHRLTEQRQGTTQRADLTNYQEVGLPTPPRSTGTRVEARWHGQQARTVLEAPGESGLHAQRRDPHRVRPTPYRARPDLGPGTVVTSPRHWRTRPTFVRTASAGPACRDQPGAVTSRRAVGAAGRSRTAVRCGTSPPCRSSW